MATRADCKFPNVNETDLRRLCGGDSVCRLGEATLVDTGFSGDADLDIGVGAFETVDGVGAFETVDGVGVFETVDGVGAFETVDGVGAFGTGGGVGGLRAAGVGADAATMSAHLGRGASGQAPTFMNSDHFPFHTFLPSRRTHTHTQQRVYFYTSRNTLWVCLL